MLDKLSVPERHTNLDNSRAGAYCLAVGAGGVAWTFFVSSSFSLFFLPFWETARYRLKYCLKGLVNANQPTNHFDLLY